MKIYASQLTGEHLGSVARIAVKTSSAHIEDKIQAVRHQASGANSTTFVKLATVEAPFVFMIPANDGWFRFERGDQLEILA